MKSQRVLRVFIDGAIMKPELGGIATYITELSRALAGRPGVEVCLATSTDSELALPSTVEVIELSAAVRHFARRLMWRERRLGALVSAWNAGVVLAPTVELPVRPLPAPTIMVVHDLGEVQEPGIHGRLRALRFATGVPLACRRADRIVCVSHATLAGLRGRFPSSAESCVVIGEAGRTLPPRARQQRASAYILVVGSMLHHKNLHTVIRAMDDPALANVELVFAGPADERERKRFATWCEATNAQTRITHLGYVDQSSLADLYAGAAVVALPSVYEGFGLPLLEAMRYGAPAVASSIAAYREVGADAAIYVEDPRSPREWARALATAINDSDLAERLSREGRERANGITWEAVAEQMEALARDLVASTKDARSTPAVL